MNTFINQEQVNENTYPLKITLEKSIPLCYSKCKKNNFTNKFKDTKELCTESYFGSSQEIDYYFAEMLEARFR